MSFEACVLLLCAALVVPLCAAAAGQQGGRELRIGMIGLDTSHVVAFTNLLNDPSNPDHVPGARVVAAYPGGSPDVPASANRLEKFTNELRQRGIEIVEDIPTLCSMVDAIMLESVDGRKHLEQVRPVFAARKRVFIDKPFAASLADAREIVRLSRESGVPFFSCSAYRCSPEFRALRGGNEEIGKLLGCDALSPAPEEPTHPPYFWYGIHGVEALYTVMGPGCEWVQTFASQDSDVVVGRWRDGRIGTFRAVRKGKVTTQVTAYGEKKTVTTTGTIYRPLVQAIVEFFRTGEPPVAPEETLEIVEFMTAAGLSKQRGGERVYLAEL